MGEAARVPCDGCGKEINDRFAQCPFCGAQRRAAAEVRPTSLDRGYQPTPGLMADRGVPKEARIAMARNVMTGRPEREVVTGPISAMKSALIPSSHTRSWLRYTELALTAISFPFFVASLLGLMVAVKKWGRVSAIDWVSGAFFGSFAVWMLLFMAGVTPTLAFWLTGVGFVAWCARGVVRFIGAAQRMGDYS